MASEKWTWEATELECQRRGWEVHRTNFQVGRRSQDLFGFIDAIAMAPDSAQTIAIQFTSRSNVAARVRKVRESPLFRFVRDLMWDVRVWGFDTGKDGVLRLREEILS